MRKLSGQAARICGIVLHRLATLALGTGVVLVVLLAAGAWRLSQGPVDLSWFTGRLEAQINANGGPTRLSIGSTALAWEGFRLGVDHPLDLRLTNIRLTDTSGIRQVDIPRAAVSLSLGALLLGRMQPRAVELDNPHLTLRRGPDGTLSLDLGNLAEATDNPAAGPEPASGGDPLPALLAALARPPTTDQTGAPGWLSQIRRVRVHDATLVIVDSGLGVTWRAPRAEIDLTRRAAGGVNGSVDLALAMGNETARLTATATLSAGATETELNAKLTPVAPAALARETPGLAFLAALDAPMGAEAMVHLGPKLDLQQMHVTLESERGTLRIGAGSVPIERAMVTVTGTPEAMDVAAAQVVLRGRDDGPTTTLTGTGTIRRQVGRFDASLSLGLDQLDFADLSRLWPEGVGGGARAWVIANITTGIARNGHAEVSLTGSDDLSDVTVTRAAGTLDGIGVTAYWLRPVPPLEQGRAQLRVVDPDTLEIAVQSARQDVRGSSNGLTVTGGSMRITGLSQADQAGEIHAYIVGSLPDALALLREHRLHLLDRIPVSLKNPAGDATASLTVTLPLDAHVRFDDITIQATARVQNTRLDAVVAGRDLDHGTLDLSVSNDGLTVKGPAQLAGIPATVNAAMDFRAGPPTQVLQRMTVSGRASAAQLAAAGLDATEVLAGSLGLQAVVTELRNGQSSVQVDADMSEATLAITPLDWRKPLGAGARASALLRLVSDRLDSIDAIALGGEGVSLRATAECTDGRVSLLRIDRMLVGHTAFQGTIRFPASSKAAPIAISLSGSELDLSARLARPSSGRQAPHAEPPPGPRWTLDAHFDHALLANGYVVAPLAVQAENDGVIFSRLHVSGFTRDRAPFALQIAPEHGVRHLTASAVKAGDLLRALDLLDTMRDGTLAITGTYDDNLPGHPLTGSAELDDFRVGQAAALGRLLQAMTLYGLVDVMRGPGLAFAKLVAPFRLSDDVLELTDARAFSPSLGLTAKGQIDVDSGQADIQGTIVPAYFFNSLLGNVPLVGRLFSPERGGGVFAARYTVRGRLADPEVVVNPLTALTPGFLRGLFGIF